MHQFTKCIRRSMQMSLTYLLWTGIVIFEHSIVKLFSLNTRNQDTLYQKMIYVIGYELSTLYSRKPLVIGHIRLIVKCSLYQSNTVLTFLVPVHIMGIPPLK